MFCFNNMGRVKFFLKNMVGCTVVVIFGYLEKCGSRD